MSGSSFYRSLFPDKEKEEQRGRRCRASRRGVDSIYRLLNSTAPLSQMDQIFLALIWMSDERCVSEYPQATPALLSCKVGIAASSSRGTERD